MLANGELKPINTATGTACKPLAPDIRSAKKGTCCDPCGTTCDPKVRLKDYIVVKPGIEQTCFKIGEDDCAAEVLPAHLHCFTAHINPRGECRCVLTLTPVRATTDGKVCFAWSEAFWLLGDGRYEMEIKIDGKCSVVAGLDVRGCHQAILAYEHARSNACAVAPSCAPQIEDEPYTADIADCGGCSSGKCY